MRFFRFQILSKNKNHISRNLDYVSLDVFYESQISFIIMGTRIHKGDWDVLEINSLTDIHFI